MTSHDDLALLKQMHQRGEITDAQYDVLRRHVLWGTPLPQLGDEPPAPPPHPDPVAPVGYAARSGPVGPGRYPESGSPRRTYGRREPEQYAGDPGVGRYPGDPGVGRYAGDPDVGRYPGEPGVGRYPADPGPGGRPYASRRERREAEEAAGYPPSYPVPAGERAVPRAGLDALDERAGPDPQGGVGRAGRGPERSGPDPADYAPRRRAAADRDRPSEADGDAQGDRERRARRPRRRSLLAVLTSLVLALALAAGGVYWFVLRTQGAPPATYAREACSAVHDWQQAVDTSNAALVTQISREEDKSVVRAAVTTYYTTVAARTDRLRTAILGLQPPDIAGGRDYSDSLAAAVGDQATALRGLAVRAGRLDPAAATFPTDLHGVLTGADTAVGAVTAALARPAAGISTELRTVLSDDPTCAPYVG